MRPRSGAGALSFESEAQSVAFNDCLSNNLAVDFGFDGGSFVLGRPDGFEGIQDPK
jgi:hypothetical protein